MKNFYLMIAVVCMAIVTSCSNNEEISSEGTKDTLAVSENRTDAAPREGDLCSVVKDSTGRSFGVIKILKIEGETYHLRTYGVTYENRPTETDLKDIKPNHSAGIGHLPLSKQQFENWKPEVITNQSVSLEELEGYNIWKNGQKK